MLKSNSKLNKQGLMVPNAHSMKKRNHQSKVTVKKAKKPNLVRKLNDSLTANTVKPSHFKKNIKSGLVNGTTLESSNSGTTKRGSYRIVNPQLFNNKDELTPAKKSGVSQIIEEEDKKLDEVVLKSPQQDSDRGKHDEKEISNLTLEEYMLNYGRPYRNSSVKKVESVTTWRVVNEDPSESYITVDEEFEKETQNPVSKSADPEREMPSEDNISPSKKSEEKKSQIKLSILSVLKKKPTHIYKKQRSTSKILDDIERKVSSPLLQNAMSAFFNTSKAPAPAGPKSIRMSSNASILYPIREEKGAKMSIHEDILDEVSSSSPRSSISEEKGLRDIEENSAPDGELLHAERRGTNVMLKLPKDQRLQLETNSPRTNRPSQFKEKSFMSLKSP